MAPLDARFADLNLDTRVPQRVVGRPSPVAAEGQL